jgi:hypothetical protein
VRHENVAVTPPLEEVFKTSVPARDNYLARLLAIFSEDVVRHWCDQPGARYENLGRPTLWPLDGSRYHTLDFTLRDRTAGRTYISELKCELAWENYRYLRLTGPEQLRHHTGAAFQAFLSLGQQPGNYEVRLAGKPISVDGAILVWGSTTPAGAATVKAEHGLSDVLSVEDMIRELSLWRTGSWERRIADLRGWSNALFDYLAPAGGSTNE